MAETTTHNEEMTREETAEFLRTIADGLDSQQGKIRIPIGNKEVLLSPPDTIDSEATVTERSRRLRQDTEELSLTFKWNPAKDTAESTNESDVETGADAGADAGAQAESESGAEIESEPGHETNR